jgi:VWFA-related protein
MEVGYKMSAAGQAAHHLLSWLKPGTDEVALFAFDTELQEIVPFTSDTMRVLGSLDQVKPFGATSLRDAIAAAARRVVERGRLRRAVVVLTDGVDTASKMSAPEVSGVASAIDVPVYILAVISPLDHVGEKSAVASPESSPLTGDLTDLARWTGGALLMSSAPAHASLAARQIVTELRHQYLIVFEPSAVPGWHPLELRARDKDFTVRARSGYFAGHTRPVGSAH